MKPAATLGVAMSTVGVLWSLHAGRADFAILMLVCCVINSALVSYAIQNGLKP